MRIMLKAAAAAAIAIASLAAPAAGQQTTYLNPSTGRDCVEDVNQTVNNLSSTYQRRIEYRVTFRNSCDRTFRIVGEILPASTFSGGSYYLTRTTGISGHGQSDLVCQDDGSSTACVGWAGYRIE